jgi:hypothetical protein
MPAPFLICPFTAFSAATCPRHLAQYGHVCICQCGHVS